MKQILLLFILTIGINVSFAAERKPINKKTIDCNQELTIFISMGSSITSHESSLDAQTGLHINLFGEVSLVEKRVSSNGTHSDRKRLSQTGFHTNSSGSLIIEIE